MPKFAGDFGLGELDGFAFAHCREVGDAVFLAEINQFRARVGFVHGIGVDILVCAPPVVAGVVQNEYHADLFGRVGYAFVLLCV